MPFLLLLAAAIAIPDIDGVARRPMAPGKLGVVFFVTHDCPVSNAFAPEMRRICSEYRERGVECTLAYVDPSLTVEEVRKHAGEYGHQDYPKLVDRKHELVKATGARVTPEAAVVKPDGSVAYLGRINDSYLILGQSRRTAQHRDLRNALDELLAGKPVSQPRTKAVGCYIPDLSVLSKRP